MTLKLVRSVGDSGEEVLNVSGYSPLPSSGTVIVFNEPVSIDITFVPTVEMGYLVTSLVTLRRY